MIDHFRFDGDDFVESFKLALAQGQDFIEKNPESTFQILFDSNQNKIILDYQVTSLRRHFFPLFGPGNVPGMCSEEDIKAFVELAKKLPKSGILVELGPLFGKSTVEWAKNLKKLNKDYKIIAIDSFNTRIDIIHELLTEAEFDVPPGENHLEVFKHYTKDFPNIHPLEVLWTTESILNMKVTAVFEDLTATSKADSNLLQYWWDKIEPGGMLCGKQYPSSADVKFAVDQFVLLNDCKLETFKGSSAWCVEKK